MTAPHVTVCQVRWIDIDAYRHVNNTVYLRYLEQARVEMFAGLGGFGTSPRDPAAESSDGFVIAELEIAYRRPIVFRPEPVEVRTWVTHVGNSSWTVGHSIRDVGAESVEYASAPCRQVAIDRVSTRSRPLRAYEREFLALHQTADPEAPE